MTPFTHVNVFSDFFTLKDSLPGPLNLARRWQNDYKRWDILHPDIDVIGKSLEPLARQLFGSPNLSASYSVYVKYEGAGMTLPRHLDKNACTYTLDICLSQSRPWGLWVEGVEYLIGPNEAVCYLGEAQEHWRETRHENDGWAELLLCHYVTPDHWWWGNYSK